MLPPLDTSQKHICMNNASYNYYYNHLNDDNIFQVIIDSHILLTGHYATYQELKIWLDEQCLAEQLIYSNEPISNSRDFFKIK